MPGLDDKGFIDHSFFKPNLYSEDEVADVLEKEFDSFKDGAFMHDERALLLCSGGVDSSLLACLRKDNLEGYRQAFLHTSYIDHEDNDISKFNNILDKCESVSYISTIGSQQYIRGIEWLSSNGFHQNTYAPTLALALQCIPKGLYNNFITGSGPDELFYGMEKYTWDVFEKLKDMPINLALEKLDPRYNESAYLPLFNDEGKEGYESVLKKRRQLYIEI